MVAGVLPSTGPPRASPTAAPLSAPAALSMSGSATRDLVPAIGELRLHVLEADAVGEVLLERRSGGLVAPLRVGTGELERGGDQELAAGEDLVPTVLPTGRLEHRVAGCSRGRD